MKRTGLVILIAVVVLIAAVAVIAGCEKTRTGNTDSGNVDNNKSTTVDSGEDGTTPENEPEVSVFFISGEKDFAVTREVEGGVPGALSALLGGPNGSEKAKGCETAIPEGVQVNNYKVEDGIAKVDFSGELLNYGGGSARVEAIIRQIEKTILENDPSIKSVEISVNGVPSGQCLQP